METKRKHFHTFDALRFFSFFLVFLQHIPFLNNTPFRFFSNSGGIGVTFFFVLSGFLISYILLHEKIATHKINLKNFFIRRVLRIWPLYFAMILFAFLTPYILDLLHLSSSNEGYEPNWWYSIFFVENYRMMFTHSFPNVSPLRIMWSLCVEEHFYIIWGLVFYFISIKRVPYFIGISIVVATISRIIYGYYGLSTSDVFSNIDYFAFGAIPAYLLVQKNAVLSKLETVPLYLKQFFLVATFAFVFLIPMIHFKGFNYLFPIVLGILFATIIGFTISVKNPLKIKDSYWVSKLGKYTYGLYLFHTIVINLLLQLANNVTFLSNKLIFISIAMLLTVIISILSYNLFEKQFLKLKKHFR